MVEMMMAMEISFYKDIKGRICAQIDRDGICQRISMDDAIRWIGHRIDRKNIIGKIFKIK
jgi:hypothetical protein